MNNLDSFVMPKTLPGTYQPKKYKFAFFTSFRPSSGSAKPMLASVVILTMAAQKMTRTKVKTPSILVPTNRTEATGDS